MSDDLIVRVGGSWVSLADFQSVVGEVIAAGLRLVPEEELAEAEQLCFEMLDELIDQALPRRPSDLVMQGETAEAVFREFIAEVTRGIRPERHLEPESGR